MCKQTRHYALAISSVLTEHTVLTVLSVSNGFAGISVGVNMPAARLLLADDFRLGRIDSDLIPIDID